MPRFRRLGWGQDPPNLGGHGVQKIIRVLADLTADHRKFDHDVRLPRILGRAAQVEYTGWVGARTQQNCDFVVWGGGPAPGQSTCHNSYPHITDTQLKIKALSHRFLSLPKDKQADQAGKGDYLISTHLKVIPVLYHLDLLVTVFSVSWGAALPVPCRSPERWRSFAQGLECHFWSVYSMAEPLGSALRPLGSHISLPSPRSVPAGVTTLWVPFPYLAPTLGESLLEWLFFS